MYCTREDLVARLSEQKLVRLTDDAGSGAADEAVISRAMEDASQEIDAYLGARHRVPLEPAPPVLRRMAADIAAYLLCDRQSGTIPEAMDAKYQAAIRFLRDVAKGVVSLGAADPEGSPQPAEAPQMHPDNPPRLFGRDSMKGF